MALSLFHKQEPLVILGLMAGTSLDGIDACAVSCLATPTGFRWQFLGSHSGQYTPGLRQQLLAIQQPDARVTLHHVAELNRDIALAFAYVAKGLQQQLQAQGKTVQAVASHGQTVFHGPPTTHVTAASLPGCTLQLGEGAYLAHQLNVPVVYNFRPGDMAAHGQGAPLVPYAETLLFDPLMRQGKRLIIQNIGGIANATILAPPQVPMAFDTGPGNMLMDAACQQLTGKPYDCHGELAAQGPIDDTLLAHLMTDPYLKQAPPKSTGRDYYGNGYLTALFNRFAQRPASVWLATLTAFTAHSIVDAYQRWVFPQTTVDGIIIGGGGTKNPVLMRHLRQLLDPIPVHTHQEFGIPDQYKEALAFALLGWATLTGQYNNMPSCTGALRPAILGSICWP
jgi:anhydro-N-acetylmuramic acid kinase